MTHRSSLLYTLAVCGSLFVIAFFLLTEHRAHTFGALPWLLLLACPLLHVFMHGGHGHDHGSHDPDSHGHASHDHGSDGHGAERPDNRQGVV